MDPETSYAEFWRTYLLAHQRPANRALHCIGMLAGGAGLAWAAAWGSAWLAGLSIAVGYGCSWIGHYAIEGNRPESFRRPVWSLVSAFRMFAWTVTGRDFR